MRNLILVVLLSAMSCGSYGDLARKNPFRSGAQGRGDLITFLDSLAIPNSATSPYPTVSENISGLYELDYGTHRLWVDCATRRTLKFKFSARRLPQVPTDNLASRSYRLHREAKLPRRCQQTSTLPYGLGIKRAFLVDPAHLPRSKEVYHSAASMFNIFPLDEINGSSSLWESLSKEIDRIRHSADVEVEGELSWTRSAPFIKTHAITPPSSITVTLKYSSDDSPVVDRWDIPNRVN